MWHKEMCFMSNDKSTNYTRDVLVQMSDKQLDDAASKLKRLIRESEKKVSAGKSESSKKELADENDNLKTYEVEFCYVDDERQRRQKFSKRKSQNNRRNG